jgi:hypothetical protein
MEKIIVSINGVNFEVEGEEISYEKIAELSKQNPKNFLTTTFHWKREVQGEVFEKNGFLKKGGSVKVREGMIFNCYNC